jgi:hypothetical protein
LEPCQHHLPHLTAPLPWKNAHDVATSCAFLLDYNDRMDFFWPEEDPQRVQPAETHIQSLQVAPYPDGQRVRVRLQITPFLVPPHIDITLRDASGDEVATTSIVEPMSSQLELTMHLLGASGSPFTIHARLFYPDGPQALIVSTVFKVISQ